MTGAPLGLAPAEFDGSAVLLTGVGRAGQVGEIVAGAFASHGATLIIIDREGDAVRQRAAELSSTGRHVHPVACDLTDPEQATAAAEQAKALAPGGLAAMVHLAGGYADGTAVSEMDPGHWQRMFAINLTTAFVASRAFLPLVRAARGSIVFFASAAALPGASVARTAAYAAAKGGVVTLMRAIAAEERGSGVRANALAPTAIRTAQNITSMGDDKAYVERETVAAWVLWLCSSAAGPVSGQVIRLG